jgi:hypothetical protein
VYVPQTPQQRLTGPLIRSQPAHLMNTPVIEAISQPRNAPVSEDTRHHLVVIGQVGGLLGSPKTWLQSALGPHVESVRLPFTSGSTGMILGPSDADWSLSSMWDRRFPWNSLRRRSEVRLLGQRTVPFHAIVRVNLVSQLCKQF